MNPEFDDHEIKETYESPSTTNTLREGKFFNYALKDTYSKHTELVKELLKLQIFTEGDYKLLNKRKNQSMAEILEDSCFIYALKQFGVEESILDELRVDYKDKCIPMSKIQQIIDKYGLNISIRYIDENQARSGPASRKSQFKKSPEVLAKPEIIINLFDQHYFLEYKTTMTT
jgi:hypothetical protein